MNNRLNLLLKSETLLFRGKSVSTNKNITGGTLIQTAAGIFILPSDASVFITRDTDKIVQIDAQRIIPETLSRCTSLFDKNNNPIYEGDIISVPQLDPVCKLPLDGDNLRVNGLVVFAYGAFCVYYAEDNYIHILHDVCENSVVIGNRFDNPELLEGYNE